MKKKNKVIRSRFYTSVLLVLMALVAVTAATVAWFSIADNTRVRSMSLDIVSDVDLRMDLDAHRTIDQYVKTLSFESIAARILQEKGFSMETTPMKPVPPRTAARLPLRTAVQQMPQAAFIWNLPCTLWQKRT